MFLFCVPRIGFGINRRTILGYFRERPIGTPGRRPITFGHGQSMLRHHKEIVTG